MRWVALELAQPVTHRGMVQHRLQPILWWQHRVHGRIDHVRTGDRPEQVAHHLALVEDAGGSHNELLFIQPPSHFRFQ